MSRSRQWLTPEELDLHLETKRREAEVERKAKESKPKTQRARAKRKIGSTERKDPIVWGSSIVAPGKAMQHYDIPRDTDDVLEWSSDDTPLLKNCKTCGEVVYCENGKCVICGK
jgi:hypothetical protein